MSDHSFVFILLSQSLISSGGVISSGCAWFRQKLHVDVWRKAQRKFNVAMFCQCLGNLEKCILPFLHLTQYFFSQRFIALTAQPGVSFFSLQYDEILKIYQQQKSHF